jgi:sulfite oxidase
MNDAPLSKDRGGPIRLVVPGFVGARWVKWLDTISLSSEESPNHYQQQDYKVLPPDIESQEHLNWGKYPAMESLPLNSVVASIEPQEVGSLVVKGYATASCEAGVNVVGVDVSIDDGETWIPAKITYQEGRWSWTLWEARMENVTEGSGVVVSRATDSHGDQQPRQSLWNLRGVAYNGWGRNAW